MLLATPSGMRRLYCLYWQAYLVTTTQLSLFWRLQMTYWSLMLYCLSCCKLNRDLPSWGSHHHLATRRTSASPATTPAVATRVATTTGRLHLILLASLQARAASTVASLGTTRESAANCREMRQHAPGVATTTPTMVATSTSHQHLHHQLHCWQVG